MDRPPKISAGCHSHCDTSNVHLAFIKGVTRIKIWGVVIIETPTLTCTSLKNSFFFSNSFSPLLFPSPFFCLKDYLVLLQNHQTEKSLHQHQPRPTNPSRKLVAFSCSESCQQIEAIRIMDALLNYPNYPIPHACQLNDCHIFQEHMNPKQ